MPNGGSRHKLEAINLKRQGVKSGVADMLLLVPRAGYHGMALELKVGKNKLTDNQRSFIFSMEQQGYFADVAFGADKAIELIKWYLNLKG